jgi:glycerol-3-phosphate dehydrogenase
VNRDQAINALSSGERWDVLVIGGGATGLGAAVDSASRGYRTVLVEQHDFAKATSSRSTKLVHGGVRYLKQGNISLVRESLHERALLLRNAPHLARTQAFIVPAYSWMDLPFYGIGLKTYDALAGKFSLGPSSVISREKTIRELPTVRADKLRGGIRYFDGQFDDAGLAVCLAQKLFGLGGFAVNYVRVDHLLKEAGKITGAVAVDVESGREFEIRARVVINATGVFTDNLRRQDDPQITPMLSVSQGAHIVLDRSFFPGESALMIPKTADGRVLFAIPWQGKVLLGTTDTAVNDAVLEPRPLAQEIEFLLDHARKYLTRAPNESDVLSTFAGLRPLVKSGATRSTSALSRDHTIVISPSGLVTITGGKWTTYRRMGEDVVNQAAEVGDLAKAVSRTRDLPLNSTCAENIDQLAREDATLMAPLHPRFPYRKADVIHACRHAMARSVEDVLSRRTRMLLLDARAAIKSAPAVAKLIAIELKRDEAWQRDQVSSFETLARLYLLR